MRSMRLERRPRGRPGRERVGDRTTAAFARVGGGASVSPGCACPPRRSYDRLLCPTLACTWPRRWPGSTTSRWTRCNGSLRLATEPCSSRPLGRGCARATLDGAARRALKALLRRIELTPSGVDLWIPSGHFADPARSDRAVAAVSETVELAAELGRVPVSFNLPSIASEDADLRDVVESMLGHADRHGIDLVDCATPPASDAVRATLAHAGRLRVGGGSCRVAGPARRSRRGDRGARCAARWSPALRPHAVGNASADCRRRVRRGSRGRSARRRSVRCDALSGRPAGDAGGGSSTVARAMGGARADQGGVGASQRGRAGVRRVRGARRAHARSGRRPCDAYLRRSQTRWASCGAISFETAVSTALTLPGTANRKVSPPCAGSRITNPPTARLSIAAGPTCS
jgi:hypothetical protein